MLELLRTSIIPLLTAFAGIFVFVIGQFAQKFILEPIQKQKEIIGEIAIQLIYLADISDVDKRRRRGHKVPEPREVEDLEKNLRRLAGQLQASMEIIPKYEWCTRCGWVKSKEAIARSSYHLVQWSKTIRKGNPVHDQRKIAEHLGLKIEALILRNADVPTRIASTNPQLS